MAALGENKAGGTRAVRPRAQRKKRRADFSWKKLLGTGAFSKVYYVTPVGAETGRAYAIKVIDKQLVMRLRQQHQVFRERDIMARLVHENICNLYYTFQDPSYLFFVLELCHGGTLFDVITEHGKLNNKAAVFYTAEMVNALSYLHSKNIAHRDLKPENVLLSADGHAKLADFGAASVFLSEPSGGDGKGSGADGAPNDRTVHSRGRERGRRETSGDNFCGTAEYSAPEILKNTAQESLSRMVDLWALGVSVFQMIVGKLPFRGENEYLTFDTILQYDPQTFFDQQTFPRRVSKNLMAFVKELLQVEPENRIGFGSTRDLKNHPLFLDDAKIIDWNLLQDMPAPPLAGQGQRTGYSGFSGLCCCCKDLSAPEQYRRVSVGMDDDESYFEMLYEESQRG